VAGKQERRRRVRLARDGSSHGGHGEAEIMREEGKRW
jgi:hypothetical protein